MAFTGAGSESLVWIVPPAGIIDNIHKMRRRTLRKARSELDAFADYTENWMKSNHPWQNDTGTAEASLVAITSGADGSDENEDIMTMNIGYSMAVLMTHPDGRQRDYSVFLEGYLNLSILIPTKNIVFPQFSPKLKGKLSL